MKIILFLLLTIPLFATPKQARFRLTLNETQKEQTAHLTGIELINLKSCTTRLSLKKLYHKKGKKKFNNPLRYSVNRKRFKENCHGENYTHALFSPIIRELLHHTPPEGLTRTRTEKILGEHYSYTTHYTPAESTDRVKKYNIDLQIQRGSFQKKIPGGTGILILTLDEDSSLLKQETTLTTGEGDQKKSYRLIRERISRGKN